MKYVNIEVLETTHLILRRFRESDVADFYARVGGNEKITKYMLWEPHKSVEETKSSVEKILRRYETENAYTWAIARKEDDSVIGRIDLLRIDEAEESCSFAYMIGDAYWGQGLGTEVLAAVFAFAFEKMEMKLIVADHMSENGASGAVMRKVGMRHVGVCKDRYEKAGIVYNADEYSITYEQWQENVKSGREKC